MFRSTLSNYVTYPTLKIDSHIFVLPRAIRSPTCFENSQLCFRSTQSNYVTYPALKIYSHVSFTQSNYVTYPALKIYSHVSFYLEQLCHLPYLENSQSCFCFTQSNYESFQRSNSVSFLTKQAMWIIYFVSVLLSKIS